jgi:hypothetical protein
MGKLTSKSGKNYTTRDVSRNAFVVKDDKGVQSTYAFEDDGSAIEHINRTEANGKSVDSL